MRVDLKPIDEGPQKMTLDRPVPSESSAPIPSLLRLSATG